MKRVFICSPLRGDIEGNLTKAREYCRAEALAGNVPIAPHVYFTQFLDEHNPQERELGIKLGMELLKTCDEIKIFGDRFISSGMTEEIVFASQCGIPQIFCKA